MAIIVLIGFTFFGNKTVNANEATVTHPKITNNESKSNITPRMSDAQKLIILFNPSDIKSPTAEPIKETIAKHALTEKAYPPWQIYPER